MPTGIEMLLKSAGLDITKVMADFTTLKDGVIQTLKSIEGKLENIEKRQEEIWTKLQQQPNMQPPAQQPPAVQNQPQTLPPANPS